MNDEKVESGEGIQEVISDFEKLRLVLMFSQVTTVGSPAKKPKLEEQKTKEDLEQEEAEAAVVSHNPPISALTASFG